VARAQPRASDGASALRHREEKEHMRYLAALVLAAMVVTPALASDVAESIRDNVPPDYTPYPLGEGVSPTMVVLFDNGPLVNCAGCGAGGADESVLQTALGMTLFGFGHQHALGYAIADGFDVTDAAGWGVENAHTWSYQTGSTTTSTITGVFITLYNGMPGGGGLPIWGDYTTNVMSSTAWDNMYRVTDTTSGTTSRPVMEQVSAINTVLTPGSYWMGWNTDGTLSSGPWVPPVTINGQITTGDGLQSLDGGATWAAALDGSGGQQGIPFVLEGIVGPGTPVEAVSWSQLRSNFRD
jgi:hypothetical protein